MAETFMVVSLEIAGAVLAATFFIIDSVRQEAAVRLRVAAARRPLSR